MEYEDAAKVVKHTMHRMGQLTGFDYGDGLTAVVLTNRKTGAEVVLPALSDFNRTVILGYVPDWRDWDACMFSRSDNRDADNLWYDPLGGIEGGGRSAHPKVAMLDPDNPPVGLRNDRTGIDMSV